MITRLRDISGADELIQFPNQTTERRPYRVLTFSLYCRNYTCVPSRLKFGLAAIEMRMESTSSRQRTLRNDRFLQTNPFPLCRTGFLSPICLYLFGLWSRLFSFVPSFALLYFTSTFSTFPRRKAILQCAIKRMDNLAATPRQLETVTKPPWSRLLTLRPLKSPRSVLRMADKSTPHQNAFVQEAVLRHHPRPLLNLLINHGTYSSAKTSPSNSSCLACSNVSTIAKLKNGKRYSSGKKMVPHSPSLV